MQNFLISEPLFDDVHEKPSVLERISSIIVNVLIAAMLLLLVMYVTVEPISVSGKSMENGLVNDDTVVINKFYFSPKRGDVVVIIHNPMLIKRVIAVSGDKLGFAVNDENHDVIDLYLDKNDGNGFVRQDEEYLKEVMSFELMESYHANVDNIFKEIKIAESYEKMVENETFVTVGKGKFIALGDNRNISLDSRHYGEFDSSDIAGVKFAKLEKNSFFYKFFGFFYSEEKPSNNNR